MLKELIARNQGLTLLNLKKTSKYSSVTTMSGQCYVEQESPAVPTPVPHGDDHLSEVTSSIPPVVFILKQTAFRALLLMEDVDFGDSSPDASLEHAVFSMQTSKGPTGQVPGAEPSANNMPVSEHHVHTLQQVVWAKAEGIQPWTHVDLPIPT